MTNEQKEILYFLTEDVSQIDEIEIDFRGIKENGVINEIFFYNALGNAVKTILKKLFGGIGPNVKLRGSKRDVKSFANAIKNEKEYINSYMKYGLDNPKTYRNRYKLDRAIEKFTRDTGLKWPFK